MERLPAELVSRVLVWASWRDNYRLHYTAEATGSNKDNGTYSLVCRYWEQAVVNTPQLWSYIHLSQRTTEQTLRRRLKLSKGVELDVRVNVGYDCNIHRSKTFPVLHDILVETIDWWRSFAFEGILYSDSINRWIPSNLPNVVEAAYHGLVEDSDEGLHMMDDETGEISEVRFKPWTTAPKLERFLVETSGQFYFAGCPMLKEFTISDFGEWWGGSSEDRSWHDKWEDYTTLLASLCPQLEYLEIGGYHDGEGNDSMEWMTKETKWSSFPHLRTLKLDYLPLSILLPIVSKFNAPNLQTLKLGHIHACLPLPVPSVSFNINAAVCQIHFDQSPLHAIRLFLEKWSPSDIGFLSINFAGAFQSQFRFKDERGDDLEGEPARILDDWVWFTQHAPSVKWVLPEYLEDIVLQEGEGELSLGMAITLGVTWKMARSNQPTHPEIDRDSLWPIPDPDSDPDSDSDS